MSGLALLGITMSLVMIKTRNNTLVFPIAMGGAAIGSCSSKIFFGKPISNIEAVRTVLYALENGVNLFDTSPFYGNSEYKIGLAIQEYGNRESFIISTKVGTSPQFKGYSADLFMRSIDESLHLLRVDYLDIVHIHDPDEQDFETMLGKNGGMEVMLKLKEQGVIRYIGLGVRKHSLHHKFINTGMADVILPYLDYNLINQSATNLLEQAKEKKVGVLLGSPLCMGLLSGTDPRQIYISHYDIANEISTSRASEIYQWCLSKAINVMALNFNFILKNNSIDALLVGVSSPEEIISCLHAYREQISTEMMDEFWTWFNKEGMPLTT